jgi:general secretion pathway protein A
MYSEYFGFSDLPFTIAPDPRYLYLSAQHREALASLLYGINCNGGFVLLTGDVGTGKTTVCRCLLEQLPESAEVAFILNPKYSITELLEAVCDELKISYKRSRTQIKGYIDVLNAHLLEAHAKGINTVLIIDEAQNLSLEVLEQIRLLTNLETSSQKLLQIVLIGQPELLDKLARPELRQLNQRITARYHLNALSHAELSAYVSHRLAVGGSEAPLFTKAALWRLHRLTQGVPRMVNIICDRALLGAYVERRSKVGWGVLGRAAHEVRGDQAGPLSRRRLGLLLITLLGLMLGSAWWYPEGAVVGLLAKLPAFTGEVQASLVPPELAEAHVADEPTVAAVPEQNVPVVVGQPEVGVPTNTPLTSPGDWQWPAGTDLAATEVLAYQGLFSLWGIEYDPAVAPVVCQFARMHRLGCLLQPANLDELLKLNQPAVINLSNGAGESFFATLGSVDQRNGLARVSIAGEVRMVELAELRRWLQSNQLVLWRMPPDYQSPLRPEARSALVPWLEAQLAWIQGRQPATSRNEHYDQELQLQVLAFQHHYRLETDAVVGPQTLIQLSSLTDPHVPVLSELESGGE